MRSDPFTLDLTVTAPLEGEDRFRVQVLVDNKPWTVTSHVWLRGDPGPTPVPGVTQDEGGAAAERRAPGRRAGRLRS